MNLMSHLNKKIIIFVDFKKAFDSIDTTFIETALDLFGFRDSFLRWMAVFSATEKNTYCCR